MTIERAAILTDTLRLRDQVCGHLRDRIISGVLRPGHRLVERDLAEEFGVSRIPVREAIRMLTAEGFVEALSPRRIAVKGLTRRDVEELFDVREALEALAARQATARATEAGLRELAVLVERVRGAGAPDALGRAGALLRRHVIEMTGNGLLADILEPLEGRLRWLFQQVADPCRQWEEHRELYEAIASGDPDEAAACSLRHIRRSRQVALDLLTGP
ncbi:GntR family transcriptional regulator [Spongiactinospora sp. TRM90649]|uniref:GntR family transcriptional regulator n=1 Tax=Spongiactinospora sp. TRM90649 TaxID=3031114 RepID=UPI0023F8D3CE|nr:GntR family transcriptional regulator [Spongiactinospora sp. TRM90649]MDF5754991.1 GntR family transcriptional regulator [Spongiactinospora sp. TRM90649]